VLDVLEYLLEVFIYELEPQLNPRIYNNSSDYSQQEKENKMKLEDIHPLTKFSFHVSDYGKCCESHRVLSTVELCDLHLKHSRGRKYCILSFPFWFLKQRP